MKRFVEGRGVATKKKKKKQNPRIMASNITIASSYVGALYEKFSNFRRIPYKNDMICSLEK